MPAVPKPKTTLRYVHHPNPPPSPQQNIDNRPADQPPFPYPPSDSDINTKNMPPPHRQPANSPYTPVRPYDEPASFPDYPSRIKRPGVKAGTDGTFSSEWEVRITSFELFVMMLAMLALLVILAWLVVLLIDWLLPRSRSRGRTVVQARKLSRAFSTFKWDAPEVSGHHHPGIPMHHARSGSERYSDRDGRPLRDEQGRVQGTSSIIGHNLNLLGLGGRSRAGSMRDSHRDSQAQSSTSRIGSGSVKEVGAGIGTHGHGHVDVEKGHGNGEWKENGENVDVRRRSGAV